MTTTKPKLLDLFCGAGGASVGYARAGFDVTGVDIQAHPDYPYEIIVGDAMEILKDTAFLRTFDAITGSPPCPRYSRATNPKNRDNHPDLVGPVREALHQWSGPHIIENVPGAPLVDPVVLCGSMFGLQVRRHRLFESNVTLSAPSCDHKGQGQPIGVYGHANGSFNGKRGGTTFKGLTARDTAHAQQVMGIDWMTRWADLTDAIPPAYTHHLGLQLLAAL